MLFPLGNPLLTMEARSTDHGLYTAEQNALALSNTGKLHLTRPGLQATPNRCPFSKVWKEGPNTVLDLCDAGHHSMGTTSPRILIADGIGES